MAEHYKFKIENEVFQWPSQFITGAEVRGVGAGIPESMDLFIKRPGKPGKLVLSADSIDLGDQGIEKFYAQESSSEAGSNYDSAI